MVDTWMDFSVLLEESDVFFNGLVLACLHDDLREVVALLLQRLAFDVV